MFNTATKRTVSWWVLIPVAAVVAIMAVGVTTLVTTVLAGDDPQVQVTAPEISVGAPVAADQNVVQALADGDVSYDEYQAAFGNVMSCLDNKGIKHTTPVYLDQRDSPRWNYVVGPYADGAEKDQSAQYDECFFRYEADIQGQWDKQHQPSDAKRQANVAAALACARDEGVNVKNYEDLRNIAVDPSNPNKLKVRSCFVLGEMGYDPRIPR